MSSIQLNMWQQLPKGLKTAVWIVLGILFFVVMAIVFGWLIQLLWNATIADMFGLPTISYWQALGIFVLAKILFGFGISGGNSAGSKKKKKDKEDATDAATVSERESESESENISDLADDEAFRRYWQEEGREAYESFRRGGHSGEPAGSQ